MFTSLKLKSVSSGPHREAWEAAAPPSFRSGTPLVSGKTRRRWGGQNRTIYIISPLFDAYLHPTPSNSKTFYPTVNGSSITTLDVFIVGNERPAVFLTTPPPRHFPQTSTYTYRCHIIDINTPRLSSSWGKKKRRSPCTGFEVD